MSFRQDRTNPSTAVSNWRGRSETPKGWPSTAVSTWMNGGLFGGSARYEWEKLFTSTAVDAIQDFDISSYKTTHAGLVIMAMGEASGGGQVNILIRLRNTDTSTNMALNGGNLSNQGSSIGGSANQWGGADGIEMFNTAATNYQGGDMVLMDIRTPTAANDHGYAGGNLQHSLWGNGSTPYNRISYGGGDYTSAAQFTWDTLRIEIESGYQIYGAISIYGVPNNEVNF